MSHPEFTQSSTPKSHRQTLRLLLASLSVALLIYYWPFIGGGRAFYEIDASQSFEPQLHFLFSNLSRGVQPLWNPFLYCGYAQIANPEPNIFYPINLLFLLFSFSRGLAINQIFHALLAAGGMYALATRLRLSRTGAVCSALCAGLNGFMLSTSSNFPLSNTAAWLPIVAFLWLSNWSRDRERRWAFVGLAISTAFLISAGRPEIFAPGLFIIVLCAGLKAVFESGERKKNISWLTARGLACLCGILLAMPVLLPALEWLPFSPRKEGLSPTQVLFSSASWYDWMCTVFLPPVGTFRTLFTGDRTDQTILDLLFGVKHGQAALVPSAYIGVVPVTLALIALYHRQFKPRWMLLFVALVMSLLASAQYLPFAAEVVGRFQSLAIFRFPIKLIVIPLFCVSLLAGAGLDAVLCEALRVRVLMVPAASWCLVVLTGSVLMSSDVNPVMYRLITPLGWDYVSELGVLQHAVAMRLITGGVFGLVTCGAVFAYFWRKLPANVARIILVAAVAIPLFLSAVLYPPASVPTNFYGTPSMVADYLYPRLRNEFGVCSSRNFNIECKAAWPKKAGAETEELAQYRYERSMLYQNQAYDYGIPMVNGFLVPANGRLVAAVHSLWDGFSRYHANGHSPGEIPLQNLFLYRLAKSSSAQFVTTAARFHNDRPVLTLDPRLFDLITDSGEENCRIYRVKNFNKRAYFARTIQFIPAWEPFEEQFVKPSMDGWFDDVYLTNDVQNELGNITAADVATEESPAIEADNLTHVLVHARASKPRLLVLTDTNYPGWKAFVDGQPTRMYQANEFFRAVAVPAGDHRIRFLYQPASLYWGIAFMLLGAISIGCAFWLWRNVERFETKRLS